MSPAASAVLGVVQSVNSMTCTSSPWARASLAATSTESASEPGVTPIFSAAAAARPGSASVAASDQSNVFLRVGKAWFLQLGQARRRRPHGACRHGL